MKKLVWLSLVVGVMTLTQSLHAVPVSDGKVSVTGDTTYSTSPGIKSNVTVKSATVAPKPSTSSTYLAMLSSLSTKPDGVAGSDLTTFDSYTPEPLNTGYDPKNPNKKATSSGTKSNTPAQVPDNASTVGLLGVALCGTVLIKRRLNA